MSAIAARPTGTLIQKIERHPIPLTSRPPSTGPLARLSPATDPHRPIAFARPARSVNVPAMIDIATGLSIDPPTACSPRKAISHPSDGARLQASDPSENSASPAWKTRRRPKRSASEPDSISRHAITRV